MNLDSCHLKRSLLLESSINHPFIEHFKRIFSKDFTITLSNETDVIFFSTAGVVKDMEFILERLNERLFILEKLPEMLFLLKKCLVYCFISKGLLQEAKMLFEESFSTVSESTNLQETKCFFDKVFNCAGKKRFINVNFLASLKKELFAFFKSALLGLLKTHSKIVMPKSSESRALYSPLKQDFSSYFYLNIEVQMHSEILFYLSLSSSRLFCRALKDWEEETFLLQDSFIYNVFAEIQGSAFNKQREKEEQLKSLMSKSIENQETSNRRSNNNNLQYPSNNHKTNTSQAVSSEALTISCVSTHNEHAKPSSEETIGQTDSFKLSDPNLNANLLLKHFKPPVKTRKSLKAESEFLRKFNPKFMKKQNLDKKLLRLFAFYLNQRIGEKGKQKESSGNSNEHNKYFKATPEVQFNNAGKIEGKSTLKPNIFSQLETENDFDFACKFAARLLFPPLKTSKYCFKSFTNKYLAFLFSHDIMRTLYDDFAEIYAKVISNSIISEYDLTSKEEVICGSLEYYVRGFAGFYVDLKPEESTLHHGKNNIIERLKRELLCKSSKEKELGFLRSAFALNECDDREGKDMQSCIINDAKHNNDNDEPKENDFNNSNSMDVETGVLFALAKEECDQASGVKVKSSSSFSGFELKASNKQTNSTNVLFNSNSGGIITEHFSSSSITQGSFLENNYLHGYNCDYGLTPCSLSCLDPQSTLGFNDFNYQSCNCQFNNNNSNSQEIEFKSALLENQGLERKNNTIKILLEEKSFFAEEEIRENKVFVTDFR